MIIDPSQILFICCHIKRNLFFEDSMRRLYDAGFTRILLQQTGTDSFGGYQGPCESYWRDADHFPCAWETGLKHFHKRISELQDWKYLFLCDFDLFFLGTNELQSCIDEVAGGQYDHVSRLKVPGNQAKYNFQNNQVVEVPHIEIGFTDAEQDIPLVTPHFATGYEFFSRSLWDSYTDYDLSDGRRIYRKAVEQGCKMGAHYATYGPGEQCWGEEWFHISNLTYFYHMVDGTCPSTLDPENHDHLFRMGFFAAQEEVYGTDIYPAAIQDSLRHLYDTVGGRSRCLEAWQQEISGKPMANWRAYND